MYPTTLDNYFNYELERITEAIRMQFFCKLNARQMSDFHCHFCSLAEIGIKR